MPNVHQILTSKFARSEIDRFGATQVVVAELAEIDNAQFSLFLNGHRLALALKTQVALFAVFDFFQELTDRAGGLPVNFTHPRLLRPLWKQWRESREQSNVIG